MTSLLVVDDHTLFREGMVALIGQWSEFSVVGQAEDGPSAVRLAQELQPAIVLLDVNMPGGDGLTAAARIRQVAPDCAVVMLTVSEDSDDLLEALQAGARAYILKDVPARQLKNHLRDIRDGRSVVSPSMAGVLFNRVGADEDGAESSALSERQKQIIRLVAEGESNYQIARKLGLSQNTVKKYVHLIMVKLGAANRAEAAVRAFRDGLIDQ